MFVYTDILLLQWENVKRKENALSISFFVVRLFVLRFVLVSYKYRIVENCQSPVDSTRRLNGL